MKLKGDLFGCANGEVHPRTYEAGEDCPPELEEAARETGVLEDADSTDAAAKAAADAAAKAAADVDATKAKGAAPENKAAQ